ncbi:MAG: Major facilitator superfamily [Microgenomates group bacterium GW2011_GWA1_48_10]|nr:MAG: Major facilitator superfamily [Microgenomates group bacterium GW2011_GWA1_48_10]
MSISISGAVNNLQFKTDTLELEFVKQNAFIEVLRISSFRNLWLSQLLSQVFLNLLVFSLLIRIYGLTGSNTAVSVMVLTVSVPNFVLGAVAGVFVDRWDRKLVMFLAHFLRVFAVLAFLLSSESLLWLYGLSILISLVTQFFQPAEAAMIGVLIKDKTKLLTAMSLFSLTLFSSVILGNVLAGPSVRLLGHDGTFLLVALAFGLAAVFTAQVPGESIRDRLWAVRITLKLRRWLRRDQEERTGAEPAAKEEGSVFEGFLEGLDYLHRHDGVRNAIYLMVVAQVIIGVLGTIAPGFGHQILGLEAADVSLVIMAPAAFGMILGAMVLGQYFTRSHRPGLVKFGLVSAACLLLVFSFIDKSAQISHLPVVPLAVALLLILGFCNAFLDIPVNTTIQEKTPEEVRSRVYGVLSTLTGGASILPILLAGALADLFGVRVVMAILGLFLLGVAVYYRRVVLDGRNVAENF